MVVAYRGVGDRGAGFSRVASRCLFDPLMSRRSDDREGNIFREDTFNPHVADLRNFYKVESWSKDGMHIIGMRYAGNNLEKAYEVFRAIARKGQRSRLTIRQRTRVVAEWPTK